MYKGIFQWFQSKYTLKPCLWKNFQIQYPYVQMVEGFLYCGNIVQSYGYGFQSQYWLLPLF